MSVDEVTVPALADIPDVELCALGEWPLSTGPHTFTDDDFAAAIEAAGCPAVGPPIIKLGHVDPRFDGEPAVGKVGGLRLSASGAKLVGDYNGLPGWLGSALPDGGSVIGSAYPRRSIEGTSGLICSIGHYHPFVITAVALLGVATPGVGVLSSLDSVAELYGVSASTLAKAETQAALLAAAQDIGSPWTLEASMTDPAAPVYAAGVTTEDVRRAYYDGPAGSNYNLWIMEMQLQPPQLIVCDDSSSQVYRVPVSIKGGAVTFADPQAVSVEYVDTPDDAKVAAAAAQVAASRTMLGLPEPVAVWASAADSRPAAEVQAWDGGAAVKNLGADPSTGQLKKLFALPGDSKSDSKLPHHTVSSDGTVGGPDATACSAAIAALNGGRGGADVSDADKKKAYNHLAAHLKSLGKDVPELAASADPAPEPPADPQPDVEAGGPHGAYTGTHTHEHAAGGSQGDDMTHEHSHTHSGDASHAHVHAAGANQGRESHVDLTTEQEAALRTRLGLADDAELTPDVLLAGIPEPGQAPTLTAAQLPQGTVLIDREEWDKTQQQIAKGVQAHEAQQQTMRELALDQAISAGKFAPSRREHWRRVWDANPQAAQAVLDGLTPGVIPTSEIGQPGGAEMDGVDLEFAGLFPPEPPRRGGQG